MERQLNLVFDPLITHDTFDSAVLDIVPAGQFGSMGEVSYTEYFAPTRQAEFCISGRGYAPKPILTSPAAKESLLHVQNMAIIAADGCYYTHRYGGNSQMLLYTLSGGGKLEFEGRTYLLHAGDGFWIDCSNEHFYQTTGDEWTHMVLHFAGVGTDLLHNEYAASHTAVFFRQVGGVFHRTFDQLMDDYETLSYARDVRIANDISNLLTQLIIESGKDPSSDSMLGSLQDVIRYLEAHMAEPITLDQLAEVAHTNKYHLAHEFKRLTGYSPIDYLIHLRLEKACLTLRTTRMPVGRIAEAVGIPNSQYFGKLFKKRMGVTPGGYRRAFE